MAKKNGAMVPVTKVRILIPPGASLQDIMGKLEISFQKAEPADVEGQFNQNTCCVDVAVVSPVSTVNVTD